MQQTALVFAILVIVFAGLAVLAAGSDRFYGHSAVISVGLALVLLVLAWVDLDRFLLPDVLTLPLIASGLLYTALFGAGFWLGLAGAGVGYGLVSGLAYFWRARLGREGIGLGDAKLLAAGGAWAGLLALPVILLIASASALLVVAVMAGLGKSVDRQLALPFGPMLALAIWTVWCLPFLVP